MTMTEPKFTKLIDYDALKQQFGESDPEYVSMSNEETLDQDALRFSANDRNKKSSSKQHSTQEDNDGSDLDDQDDTSKQVQKPTLTGTRLRSYAFAVLTRREYSKKDLIEKLALYAESRDEVNTLVDELSRENYQSDQRVAEMLVRSQIRKGKGPNRIKLALRAKSIDSELAKNDMNEINWYEEAYQLKVKKYGTDVSKDPKIKAKQIRFLQYRGFEMDAIMKAISRREE